ncbi:MAG: hypothetical protein DRP29_07670 [Thermodesulfobacteriota bacterium]|nr:MAG: hypothetical protein DRP29_07670 [Thermodesulfobacteriota bacterium]
MCEICHKAIAKYVCNKCGAHVCEACYDKKTGLCIVCARGKVL